MRIQKNKLAAIAGLGLALAPAAQAATIITDDVEVGANYTGAVGQSLFYIGTIASGTEGVTSQVGSFHGAASTGNTATRSGGVSFNTGFGSGNLIQEGTYAFTISVGDTTLDRNGFTTFAHRLQTTVGATVFPGGVVTTPFIALSNDETAEWTTTTITYTVGASHALIGQEFTWAADYANTLSGTKSYGVFDKVSIEFTAIPEPSTFALAALGTLGLIGTRRRRNRA